MSSDERDEIVSYLRAVLSLLKWFGSGFLVTLCGLIGLIITDHYDLAHIKRDVEWMRPKVEQIWYKNETNSIHTR